MVGLVKFSDHEQCRNSDALKNTPAKAELVYSASGRLDALSLCCQLASSHTLRPA